MMHILNSTPVLNAHNNGWVYLCDAIDDDDVISLWVRSTAGKWAQITEPVSTDEVAKDFEQFFLKETAATLEEVKADNALDTVKDVPPDTAL